MGDLTKEEIKAMKAKEAKIRKEKQAASAIHDAAVLDNMRSAIGAPTASQAEGPAPTPAPMDQMGNSMGPTGMKRGGKVGSASARADGCAIRGKTRA